MPDALRRKRRFRQWTMRTWLEHGGRIAASLLIVAALGATWLWAAPPKLSDADSNPPTHRSEEASLREAALSLPIAAALGAVLAFRPQRRGTPPRRPAVVQTQIILSVVGALVMLVVGASIARAFGIVGAA